MGYWCQVPLYMAEWNVFGTDFFTLLCRLLGENGLYSVRGLRLTVTVIVAHIWFFLTCSLCTQTVSYCCETWLVSYTAWKAILKLFVVFFCICRVIDKCGNSFMLGISWNKSDYLDPSTWSSSVACITIFHAVLSKICCLQCFDAVGWASGL